MLLNYIFMQFHFISRLDYGARLLGHECKLSIYTIDIGTVVYKVLVARGDSEL